jgi:hypothetical protein
MRADLLHVVTAVANPIRWESRIRLARNFIAHMLDSGVKLTVVECAYGERPYDLDIAGINHVPVRSKTLVWNKENLINIGISRLPQDWKYVAWLDADITFRRANWAADTVHALQLYQIVQPWSDAYDLGPHDEHMAHHLSFCRQYFQGQPVVHSGDKFWKGDGGSYEYPHPGFGWAATRDALERLGGLIEFGAMGAGDHHMALAMIGAASSSMPGGTSASYQRMLYQWQDRALLHINRNLGYVHGTIEHSFHGAKPKRQYLGRWQMFLRHGFDPDTDLKRNTTGVMELTGNKPELRRELDLYFRQRDEDANTLAS